MKRLLVLFFIFLLIGIIILTRNVYSQTISGRLVNKTGSPIQSATITVDSTKINTGTDGTYSLSVPKGVYDVNYSTQNLWIKLISFNLSSDQKDLVNYMAKTNSRTSFELNITKSQLTQVYSEKRPNNVTIGGVKATEVFSLSALTSNTWFYNATEKILYMIASSGGTIPTPNLTVDYYVIGSGGTYTAKNSSGQTIMTESNAVTVINYVLGLMKSGQKVVLSGIFTIDSTITVNKGNLYFDFSQATVNLAASTLAFKVYGGNNIFYGGQYDPFAELPAPHSHWTGQSGSSAIQIFSPYCVVDGFEFSGFTGETNVVTFSSGGSYNTIQNCYIQGEAVTGNTLVNIIAGGYHKVSNCKFDIGFTGIISLSGTNHNKIIGCEFYNWRTNGGHAIYLGGSDPANSGYHEVSNCYFHDGVNGAGLAIKCQFNKIHDNRFENITSNMAVPFSIFSELVGYTANNNEIYNNTFTNCYWGIWLGHGDDGAAPTIGNLVHDNVFTNISSTVIALNGGALRPGVTDPLLRRGCLVGETCPAPVIDTKIYYNDFHNCPKIFSGKNASLTQNTVIAYNYVNVSVPSNELSWLQSCNNSMSYQNTFFPPNTSLAMANFNYYNITDSASWYYIAPRY